MKPQKSFSLKDKISVLLFILHQLSWSSLTPERQRSILLETLVQLRLLLVCVNERPVKQEWERSETGPVKYCVSLISQFKLIDTDSSEEFADEPVTGYACSTFAGSEENTMIEARLEASSRAQLKFIKKLL